MRVPLDAYLAADGPPSEPEPYVNADLSALPVAHMPRAVAVAPALTQAELDALALNTLPVSGTWLFTMTDIIAEGICADDRKAGSRDSFEFTMDGGFSMSFEENTDPFQFDQHDTPFANPEPGVFVMDNEYETGSDHYEFRVISPTLLEGEYSGEYNDIDLYTPLEGEIPAESADDYICTYAYFFTLEAVSDG